MPTSSNASTATRSTNDSNKTNKKRERPSQEDELALEGMHPSNKSPKLSLHSLPGNTTTEETEAVAPVVDAEISLLKFPYTVKQHGQPKTDSHLELSKLHITFEMSSDDIELQLRTNMKDYEEDTGIEYVDEDGKPVDGEEIDLEAFVFYRFDQFQVFDESEDGADDDESEDDEALEEDESPATSSYPAEDEWLKSHNIQKMFLQFDTSSCSVRSIALKFNDGDDGTLRDGSYVKFIVEFTGARVTEHMAVSAMEQVLRQQAPSSLRMLLKSFVETNRCNCSEMKKRFKYIYDETSLARRPNMSYLHSDILIGDFLPFDSDEHNAVYIKQKLIPDSNVILGGGGRKGKGRLAIDVVRDTYLDGSEVSDYDDSSESDGAEDDEIDEEDEDGY